MNLESNCCGASPLWGTDLCSDCKEHADFEEDEEYLIKTKRYEETNHNFDGKQLYEFTKKYRPNDLGSTIIDYVEQLKRYN